MFSFGAFGHDSHDSLMSLKGFPKDSVVILHGNIPQRAVVIWKVWLLGVHADATFLDGKTHEHKKPINYVNDSN